MTDPDTKRELERLDDKINQQQREIQSLKDDAVKREREQLRWGLRALGALVLVMGGWIWSQVGHLFELGTQPGGGR